MYGLSLKNMVVTAMKRLKKHELEKFEKTYVDLGIKYLEYYGKYSKIDFNRLKEPQLDVRNEL